MKTYLIAKYVDDLARNEPVNVGIILFEDGRRMARFVGEDADGDIDLRRLRGMEGRRTFKSWIRYWRKALANPTVLSRNVDADASDQVVADGLVALRRSNFFVEHGGAIVLDTSEETTEATLQRLYDRLVAQRQPAASQAVTDQQPAAVERAPTLRERSISALSRAGAPIEDAARFREKVEVPVTIAGAPDTEELSFGVLNGRWHYLQQVAFDARNISETRAEAHRWALLIANSSVRDDAVFLYDGQAVEERTAYLVDILQRVAPAVDVSSEDDAASRLRSQLNLETS